ncbi:hypothetical protein PINS_up004499 [Pythium insidiosum]|nr:hypothetical protein PINS_up004499 [Pythium insidiosum]
MPRRQECPIEKNDDPMSVAVELVMQMVAAQDAAQPKSAGATVSREEVERTVQQADGDIDRAVDEVLSLLAIRSMRLEEQGSAAGTARVTQSRLQWQELCSGLGLSECHAFFKLVETMPEEERDAMLTFNGGFFQQLLLMLDEEERDEQLNEAAIAEILKDERQAQEEEHPVVQLQRLFPDYQINVIEDVLETHGYDLNAAAVALENIKAVSHVQSFATIVKAKHANTLLKSEQQAIQEERDRATPHLGSLGHFPVLPAGSKQRRHRNAAMIGGAESTTLEDFVSQRSSRSAAKTRPANAFKRGSRVANAWSTAPIDGQTTERHLASQLKIERLQRLLPTVDREIIQSTFFLNGCSSNATEAALREIFHLPAPQPRPPPCIEEEDDREQLGATAADVDDDPSYAESRARVDTCWQNLSDRYISALESFNRNHHVITADRVREVSRARRALREAQHDAAHAFVVAHHAHIRRHQPLDLHGLTVVEALRVCREVVEICRGERIRRCALICGMGNHSIDQKARLLTALQLSLERRNIAFRRDSGTIYVYPLRSSQS